MLVLVLLPDSAESELCLAMSALPVSVGYASGCTPTPMQLRAFDSGYVKNDRPVLIKCIEPERLDEQCHDITYSG